MIDLVKRLRTMAATGWNPIGDEAADTITALRAENERLRAALEWYTSSKAWTLEEVEGPFGDYGARARAALEGPHDHEDIPERD